MSAQSRRGIEAFLIVLSTSWIAAPSAAQQSEPTPARVFAPVEIDPAAFAIDVAAQRRLLDSSIRRALDPAPTARRLAEEQRLATAEARPRG